MHDLKQSYQQREGVRNGASVAKRCITLNVSCWHASLPLSLLHILSSKLCLVGFIMPSPVGSGLSATEIHSKV